MAGDWIKWVKRLPEKREVVHIAGALGLSREVVACRLMQFWEWCDDQIADSDICDGTGIVSLSPQDADNSDFIDSLVRTPGFADSLSSVGWLRLDGGRIELPNFGRHNGDTAKTRARNAKNQQNKRSGKTAPKTSHETKPGKPGKTAPVKPRARNELFDAIAAVTGLDPSTAGSAIGKVSATLGNAEPPYTPGEVYEFRDRYQTICPWAKTNRPSAGEIEKYIGLVRSGVQASGRPGKGEEKDRYMMGVLFNAIGESQEQEF